MDKPEKFNFETLDQFAWQAICNWPSHSGIEIIREGLDYGALTRYFLWDKVPRAIRAQTAPEAFAFEQALLDRARQEAVVVVPYPKWKSVVKQPFQSLERLASELRLRLSQQSRSEPVLFVPRQHASLRSALTALSHKSNIRLIAPQDCGANPNVERFQIWRSRPADSAFANQLCNGIVRGLKAFDIQLLEIDQRTLQQQLQQQASLIRQSEAELAIARPHAVLTFADNHTPLQEYVAVANRAQIPTIVLQHGLDCEQYCLNEAYAAVIAVWGDARKQRYEKNSQQQPTLRVTGNPQYDSVRLPAQLHSGTDRWLWTTRPHGSNKCYLPSRSPQEGLDILAALLAALEQTETAQLVIKPHPLDYIGLYSEQIKRRELSDRVTVSHQPLSTCLAQADIVVSEDSTAAAEAMMLGRVVVHAHFAATAPVLPLVEYQAALPANNPQILLASLQRAQSLSPATRKTMLNGQHRFVYDYMGRLDGQACQRAIALIEQVIAPTT